VDLEANKTVVSRLFDGYNRDDLSVIDELVAEDFVNHAPRTLGVRGEAPRGRDTFRRGIEQMRRLFPDIRYTIELHLAEGDLVMTRRTQRGTHLGEFRGIPPTGRVAEWTSVDVHRIRDGRIVEHWVTSDQYSLFQQLGVFPAPGPIAR